MRKAIDETLEMCVNYAQFKKVMYKKGYIINDDSNRKYATIRSINDKKATRMYQLGEQYTPKNIKDRVFNNHYYVQEQYYKFIKPRKTYKKNKVYMFNGKFKEISKITGLEALFLLLYHLLGLIPKQNTRKPLSPEMKQEVRKMQRYSNEIRLIAKEKLQTIDNVKSYISQTEKSIAQVTEIRQKYRNKLRNCKDNELIEEYKTKRDECTTILINYRNSLKVANQIIEDNPKIKEIIRIEHKQEIKNCNNQKENIKIGK